MIHLISFAADAIGDSFEEQQPLGLSALSTKDVDVILVSLEKKQWNEAHVLFARLIGKTVTTWRVPHSRLFSHVIKTIQERKKPVLIGADPSTSFEDAPKLVSAAELRSFCVSWLFLRPHLDTISHDLDSWPRLSPCQSISLVSLNGTPLREVLWPTSSAAVANHGRSGSHQVTKNHPVQLKSLSGLKLTVACLKGYFYGHNQDSCYHPLAWDIFELLKKNCNVSIDFVKLSSGREMLFGTISHKWDVAYVIALLYNVDVLVFDIPFIVIDHETFFSRKSAHRTVALSEVGRECWRLAVATMTILLLVTFTQVLVTEGRHPTVRGTTNTLTLLLAAVLATSATEPVIRRRRCGFFSRALIGLWFVFILPLSAYLRSELTSIVTLRRPAESIDTLEKLEDALDRGEMAPCATVDSATHQQLIIDEQFITQGPLLRKLRAAYQGQGPEKLKTFRFPDCLACALRHDRVCYAMLEEPCDLRERFPDVREFRQHFKILVSGLRVRKFLPAYRPLRRFFLAIQEGILIPPNAAKCSWSQNYAPHARLSFAHSYTPRSTEKSPSVLVADVSSTTVVVHKGPEEQVARAQVLQAVQLIEGLSVRCHLLWEHPVREPFYAGIQAMTFAAPCCAMRIWNSSVEGSRAISRFFRVQSVGRGWSVNSPDSPYPCNVASSDTRDKASSCEDLETMVVSPTT
ncbi:hypothetical protein MRX96_020582 [Rhipicephalus microplus]